MQAKAVRRSRAAMRPSFLEASHTFVAVYEVQHDKVHVLRIMHGAQQWPPSDRPVE
jgi:plasmid stabilization system protein ParE